MIYHRYSTIYLKEAQLGWEAARIWAPSGDDQAKGLTLQWPRQLTLRFTSGQVTRG
jgi:hypothetical protein